MWGNKKSHTPQAVDPGPKNWQTNQPPKRTPASWKGTTKINKDVMRPAGATADRATARLGSSLHVKGEISGNEDWSAIVWWPRSERMQVRALLG
jgi:hypothetical protein